MSRENSQSKCNNFGDINDNDITLNLDITAIRDQIVDKNQHFELEQEDISLINQITDHADDLLQEVNQVPPYGDTLEVFKVTDPNGNYVIDQRSTQDKSNELRRVRKAHSRSSSRFGAPVRNRRNMNRSNRDQYGRGDHTSMTPMTRGGFNLNGSSNGYDGYDDRNSYDDSIVSSRFSRGNSSRDEFGVRRRKNRSKRPGISKAVKTSRMLNSKPVYFNVMLCGKSQTGKSKFLEKFLAEGFHKRNVIKKGSDKIMEYVLEKYDDGVRFVLTAIDCPGYSDSKPIKEWYESIKYYIKRKQETYEELKRVTLKDRSSFKRGVIDCRVHLCLYFITGHRLQLNDVIYMKKLQKYTNILPVLTSVEEEVDAEEVEAYKFAINREASDYQLEWIDLDRDLGNIDLVYKELQMAPIEPCPPFWFQVENFEDSDEEVIIEFKLLCNLIMGMISIPLVNRTDVLWNLYQQRKIEEKEKMKLQEQEKLSNIGVGMALGLGAIGAIMAIKNTLF